MSIQTTPFLHLPQWTAEEQPSFLGEINPAWAAIDAGYGDIKTSAGTAITTANAAVNTANAAKSQSQANAGVITQLQQQIAQLEADFVNQSYLVNDNPEITTSHSGVTINTGAFFHNGYAAVGHFVLSLSQGSYTFNNTSPVFTVTNLPYVWKEITLNTSETYGPVGNIKVYGRSGSEPIAARLTANGDFIMFAEIEAINNVQGIDFIYSVPIFRVSASDRSNIPGQCVFLR